MVFCQKVGDNRVANWLPKQLTMKSYIPFPWEIDPEIGEWFPEEQGYA